LDIKHELIDCVLHVVSAFHKLRSNVLDERDLVVERLTDAQTVLS
jgi:hypothetical protein